MKFRNIKINGVDTGRVIFDQGMVIFQDVPEEWEDLFFQGFYLNENEDGSDDELIAPDEDPERYFKLIPLYGMEGVEFSGVLEENYE